MSKSKSEEIGQVLKRARISAGLSQGDVAKRLGYTSPQFISNIERGLANPPLKIISRLVELYEMKSRPVLKILVSQYEEQVAQALSLPKPRKSS